MRVGKIWLFDFCEVLACVSGKRQCAKCGSAFRFSFLRVGKKTKSFFFHCHFIFHSQTIISVFIVALSFLRLVGNLFIAVQKLRLASENWVANQTFVKVYFSKDQNRRWDFNIFQAGHTNVCIYFCGFTAFVSKQLLNVSQTYSGL